MAESSSAISAVIAAGYAPGSASQARSFDRAVATAPAKRRIPVVAFLVLFLSAFITVFGIGWAYVAEMPMAFLNMDYAIWTAKRAMLDNCQTGSVSVFGDSRTLTSTMPNVMSVPVTNFAMSGTTPIETYFAVARALQCPKPPKLVIISHVALKFMSDIDYWNIGAKFGLLDYDAMRAVDADAMRLHDHEIEDLRKGDQLLPVLRARLFTLRFPPFYFDSLVHGFIAGRWSLNRAALRNSLVSSGHALLGKASGSSDVAPEGEATAYEPSPLIDLYFTRTLALLQKQGVPVIFLTMPTNQATSIRIKPRFRAQFGAYLRDKARQYPALRVVGPTIPCWPDEFFGDMEHFNARGAEAYSRMLGPWLRHALAGGTPYDLPGRCLVTR